jgi:hypothetical protein
MSTQVLTSPRLDPHFVYGFDAVGSAVMGGALLLTAAPLTVLAGWALPPAFLWTIGLLLLPWAAFNAWIARKSRPAPALVMANITADIGWIAGTAALVAIHAPALSGPGLAMLVGQGVAVGGVLFFKLMGRAALAS